VKNFQTENCCSYVKRYENDIHSLSHGLFENPIKQQMKMVAASKNYENYSTPLEKSDIKQGRIGTEPSCPLFPSPPLSGENHRRLALPPYGINVLFAAYGDDKCPSLGGLAWHLSGPSRAKQANAMATGATE
jgi:hypothetical protein